MKQISMSLDEYQDEIKNARLEGSKITPRLIEIIHNSFKAWHSMDKNQWKDAMYDISTVLHELESLELKP